MSIALFISNSGDIHTDLLVNAARQAEIEFFRYNTDHIRKQGEVKFTFSSNKYKAILHLDNKSISFEDINLVVYRRPKPFYTHTGNLLPWHAKIIDTEWATIEKAFGIITNAYIINPISASAVAQNKIAQLYYAQKSGLVIPPTIISTNPSELRQFIENRECITKGISKSYVTYNDEVRTGFTRLVNPNELIHYQPSGCPTLLQERISCAAIWRVVLVGEKIFGVRYSGSQLSFQIDSRLIQEELEGECCDVPISISKGLQEMCKSIGINFCSSDFIETEQNDYVFLDLNPDGQWAWLEMDFSLPVSKTIVAQGNYL